MKPIPRRMLPNSVIYKAYQGDTGEGVSLSSPITLKNVKVEERQQERYTSNGRELVGNALMFYDLVNSSGLNDKPIPESEVIFNGKTYTVVDTDVLRANSDVPHHYEVLLK